MDVAAVAALRTEAGLRVLAEATARLADAGPRPDTVRLAAALRATYPPELAAAALTQATLRQRATAKFPPADAQRMFFTPDGLEQATRASVAELRARRFADASPRQVADLCCGIGGDAIALARAGLSVTAIDRSPLMVEIVRANADALDLTDHITARCAEIESVDLGAVDAVFCDPARRGPRGRIFDPDAYSPPWSFLVDLPRRVPSAAIKVAPGIPHERVPPDAEAEWVSDAGEVKEAVLWFGQLITGARRRATVLPAGATLTDDPQLGPPPVGPVGRYMYEPDGAVIRAGLVGEYVNLIGGRLLDPAIAYVTADKLIATPLARAYAVQDVVPANIKQLRTYLRDRNVGRVVIKKRGIAISPEDLRTQLKLRGANEVTVILTRTVRGSVAVIGHRIRPDSDRR